MIIEWLLSIVAGMWGFIGELIPDWELPPDLVNPGGMLNSIVSLGAGTAPFVPWAFVGTLAAIPLVVWVIGLLWKAFRMFASHIPFFGGNG